LIWPQDAKHLADGNILRTTADQGLDVYTLWNRSSCQIRSLPHTLVRSKSSDWLSLKNSLYHRTAFLLLPAIHLRLIMSENAPVRLKLPGDQPPLAVEVDLYY